MVILEQLFVEKRVVEEKIDRMIENLTTIKDDNGEFLLDFDGLIVDDKSWGFGTGRKGWDYTAFIKTTKSPKIPKRSKLWKNGLSSGC